MTEIKIPETPKTLKTVQEGAPYSNFSESSLDDLALGAIQELESGDREFAEKIFKQILNENIDHPGALHGMALVARQKEQWEIGTELIRRALMITPQDGFMHNTMGLLLEGGGRIEEAVEAYKLGLRFVPKNISLLNNLGSAYTKMGRSREALSSFKHAIDLGALSLEVLSNYATALSNLGQFKRAEPYYKKMLELFPEPGRHQFLYAGQLLKNGYWKDGWTYYDRRFLNQEYQQFSPYFNIPIWDGSELDNGSLLLWGEQGIGDEIRFASMIPEILPQSNKIFIECSAKLVPLFKRSFPSAEIIAAPDALKKCEGGEFDLMCPLGALGKIFRNDADDFPCHDGYLIADKSLTLEFRERLIRLGQDAKIGLCWRSGLSGAFRSDHYVEFAQLEPIFELKNKTFVNLQYDITKTELDDITANLGVHLHHWDDVDLLNDIDRAASLTKALDLVISASTSVSCLAGALGVPVLEFRPTPVPEKFLIDGHCPWFPSMRYISKRSHEPWSKVFRQIALDIG